MEFEILINAGTVGDGPEFVLLTVEAESEKDAFSAFLKTIRPEGANEYRELYKRRLLGVRRTSSAREVCSAG